MSTTINTYVDATCDVCGELVVSTADQLSLEAAQVVVDRHDKTHIGPQAAYQARLVEIGDLQSTLRDRDHLSISEPHMRHAELLQEALDLITQAISLLDPEREEG